MPRSGRNRRSRAKEQGKVTALPSSGRLTAEKAIQAYKLWRHHISDADVAGLIGVGEKTLRNRLDRNTKVKLTAEMEVDEITKGKTIIIGLADLRAVARASLEISCLVKIVGIAGKAEANGKFASALNAYFWMLEKLFPKKYGRGAWDEGRDGDEIKQIALPLAMAMEKVTKTDEKNRIGG